MYCMVTTKITKRVAIEISRDILGDVLTLEDFMNLTPGFWTMERLLEMCQTEWQKQQEWQLPCLQSTVSGSFASLELVTVMLHECLGKRTFSFFKDVAVCCYVEYSDCYISGDENVVNINIHLPVLKEENNYCLIQWPLTKKCITLRTTSHLNYA